MISDDGEHIIYSYFSRTPGPRRRYLQTNTENGASRVCVVFFGNNNNKKNKPRERWERAGGDDDDAARFVLGAPSSLPVFLSCK